jgi:putative tricarboxylic transport membrane protein
VLCAIGSYAIHSRLFEIKVMIVFGIIGYFMREMEYPVAPMVLGIILGDILDKNLRRALILSDGSLVPFFTRPICIVVFFVTVLTIFSKMKWFRRLFSQMKAGIAARLAKL